MHREICMNRGRRGYELYHVQCSDYRPMNKCVPSLLSLTPLAVGTGALTTKKTNQMTMDWSALGRNEKQGDTRRLILTLLVKFVYENAVPYLKGAEWRRGWWCLARHRQ